MNAQRRPVAVAQSSLAVVLAVVVLAVVVLAVAPLAQAASGPGPAPGEKRYQVRYDHGSARLAAWAPLTLYIDAERIRVYERNTLVHEFTPQRVTRVTHELRAPFHPGKVTERVMNDTVGACSDVITCPVLGAAGAVGAAGVGVASLFTPKEFIVTLHWEEDQQPRMLAVKVAWYQRDFILRALKKATGHEPSERMPEPSNTTAKAPAGSAQPADRQVTQTAMPTTAPPTALATPAFEQRQAAVPRTPIRRFELVLDRTVRVGDTLLDPGFYLVLVQERGNDEAVLAFVDDSRRDARTVQIAARTVVHVESGPAGAEVQPVFVSTADVTQIAEIRLPGRILRFID